MKRWLIMISCVVALVAVIGGLWGYNLSRKIAAFEAAGTPVLIDADQAEKTAEQVGMPIGGWISFQPLYDWIVTAQPDLLEE